MSNAQTTSQTVLQAKRKEVEKETLQDGGMGIWRRTRNYGVGSIDN